MVNEPGISSSDARYQSAKPQRYGLKVVRESVAAVPVGVSKARGLYPLIKEHLAGGASLHPNAAAALGTPGLAALRGAQVFPIIPRYSRALPAGRRAPRSAPRSADAGHQVGRV